MVSEVSVEGVTWRLNGIQGERGGSDVEAEWYPKRVGKE